MEYVLLGKIVNTFGIKGELKIDSFTDFPDERYKIGSKIYVGENKEEFIVNKYHFHKGFLLLQFKDNEDINLIEKYKGKHIYKSKDDIKPLKEGEYYFSDLKGLDVMLNNSKIGIVLNVEKGISSNYLRIKANDKEKLVPYLPVFIEKVDIENKQIFIKNIDGLLWK